MSINRLLILDAITCTAMGLLLAVAAAPLSGLLALPQPLLFWAGIALFPIALFMVLVGTRPAPPQAAVLLVVLGNLGWVAASVAVIGLARPNELGTAFVLAQAVVVAILAIAEFRANRGPALQPAH
ncbi:hypothetical protein [Zavarzinia sp. CC-PAN008]|uniref:hypothetical protein n=1 Tax=Zavarzinia sp. CC-PAN008 TaxID=3243332 RepID=UPI003F7458E5